MRKIIFFFLLVVPAVVLPPRQTAASGFSLGRAQIISSDGSLDVLRNPALMAFQTGTNSIGFIGGSTAYNDTIQSYGLNSLNSPSSARIHGNKFTAGGFYLSFGHKLSEGGIGIAVDSGEPCQVEYNRYDKRYVSNNGISFTDGLISGNYLRISPRFVLSYGRIVSGDHAVGFQIQAGYSRLDETYSYNGITDFIITQRHYGNKRVEEFNGQLAFGYQYRDENSQAGVMIRSGRFNFKKTKISYTYRDFIMPAFYNGSVSESFHMEYDRGFSVTAGGYRKLASFIAFGIEGEYAIPYSYDEKAPRFDEFTSFFGVTVYSAVAKKGTYGIRGGFELMPAGPVTINLGGRISTGGEKRKSRYFQESIMTDTYAGLFGLDFKFTDYMLIILGAQLEYTRVRRFDSSALFSANSIDGLSRRYNLDAHLGISFQF